jgi:hypothetical protein
MGVIFREDEGFREGEGFGQRKFSGNGVGFVWAGFAECGSFLRARLCTADE